MNKKKFLIGAGLLGLGTGLAIVFWPKSETYSLEPLKITGPVQPPPVPVPRTEALRAEPAKAAQKTSVQQNLADATGVVNTTVQSSGEVAADPQAKAKPAVAPQDTSPDLVQQNQRGTQSMYMAHASLRTNAVANPDSEENRRVLSTMVAKALARARSGSSPTPTQP